MNNIVKRLNIYIYIMFLTLLRIILYDIDLERLGCKKNKRGIQRKEGE